MKKLLLILGVLIIIFIIGWLFLRGSEAPIAQTIKDVLPFGSGEDINIPSEPREGSDSEDTSSFTESVALGKLLKLSSVPVSGMVSFSESLRVGTTTQQITVIRYVERGTGHIFDAVINPLLQTVEKRRVTNNTLPKAYEAHFKSDGNAVLLRFLPNDSDSIQNIALTLTPPRTAATSTNSLYTVSATNIRGNIDSITVGASDTLFYSLDDSSSVVSSTFTGGNLRTLFTSPFKDWRIGRAGNNLLLYSKASAEVPGYAYILGTNGSLTKTLGPLNALTALSNSNGTRILHSYFESGQAKMAVKNLQTGISNEVSPATLSEKCVASTRSSAVFFCGTPLNGLRGKEPDSWYRGISHFSDYVWRFDSDSEIAQLISEPKKDFGVELDIYEPRLTPNEDYLVFINKTDLTLWALRIQE